MLDAVTHQLGNYRIRMLLCVVFVLAVAIAAVELWPPRSTTDGNARVYTASERETIEIEEIQPTRQADAKPPPPAPPIPVLVPDDVLTEDTELAFSDNLLSIDEPGDDALLRDGDEEDVVESASGPTVGPKTVRFVEPEYTREARRNRIRAELVVDVVVDERGQVRKAEIVERFLLDRDGASKTPVNALGYGLEEAALSAADRWVFRPAQKNGKPVASRTTLTFTFGIDA